MRRRTAVAEDHGLQQARPTEVVNVVDVDARGEGDAHRRDVPTIAGGDQGIPANAISQPEIGAFRTVRAE